MWRRTINPLVVARVLIGSVFIVSSSEKLIGPYQNFLYVIEGYEILNPALAEIVAQMLPPVTNAAT